MELPFVQRRGGRRGMTVAISAMGRREFNQGRRSKLS
jgi:hypothetical protein